MAIQMGKALAFTAVGGLVAGLVGCGGDQKQADGAPAPSGDPTAAPAAAKECCKTKNACKNKGGCKTDANECAGKNECKGKGGCKSGECAE